MYIYDVDLPSLAVYIKEHFALSTAPSAALLRKTNSYIEESRKGPWMFMEFTDFLNKHHAIDEVVVSDALQKQWRKEFRKRVRAAQKARGLL